MNLHKIKNAIRCVVVCVLVIWIVKVFATSLPYKFSNHEVTQHIFGTIGLWLSAAIGDTLWGLFWKYMSYIIGMWELAISIILLLPFISWIGRKTKLFSLKVNTAKMFTLGGLGATMITGGAIFFHLFSQLWIEVLDDGGSLFYTAVTVFFGGILLFLMHRESDEKKWILWILTPRSWKHWLFWVEIVPIGFILIVWSFLSFFVHQAYTDRYPDIEVADLPTYESITLPFEHKYAIEPSLPFFASAVIDVDNDGTEEIFLGWGLNQADVLYKYQDGGFVDVTAEHGIGHEKWSETFGAAVIDADKNGYDDIFIARENDVYISFNEGWVFTEKKLNLPFNEISAPLSIALGDINKDGWVDMYVAAYIKNRFVESQTGFNLEDYGASSLLFLNNGDNTFTDITESAGMDYIHNTFQGNFVDIDNDLDVDLVVSHDTGQVRTWRNNGDNTFTNMPNPNSEQYGYPMGNAIGDYNNDWLVDFAFSNVGNMGPMNKIVRGDLRADQVYNPDIIVFENQGNFEFLDSAKDIHVADYEFSWGMLFEDLNADTREDLVISENYVQLPYNHLVYLPGRTLFQAENGKFTDKEKETNTVNRAFEIAALVADFNNDGALDMVRANLQGQSVVQMSNGINNNYLKVELPNTTESIWAKAQLTLGSGQVLTKYFITSEWLCSDGTHILYFGLGKEESLQKLEITYISGEVETVIDLGINSLVQVN